MDEAVEELTIHKLTLEETHRKHGATFAGRDGWMLPANYGNAGAEYEAIRGADGAGLIDLSTARSRIEVSGAEAVQFLNGLITNDMKTLAAGARMPAAFPNVQGRLLANVRVMRPGEETSFLFDTETATREKVFQTLARFTLAGDFRVRDISRETAQLSLQGAKSPAIIETVLGSIAAHTGRGRVTGVSWRDAHPVTITRATHTGEDGYDVFIAAGAAAALWEALTEAGARPVGFETFEILRVEAGVPRYGVDVSEANVVLEAGQEEAVSYTKGCYVGQEIIARIHWRGHVAKRLAGLVLEDQRELAAEAKVRSTDGKEIGRITSAVFSPRLARTVALGVIRYDYLQPGTQVAVVSGEDARAAQVAELPFVRGSWYATSAGDEETN
ncbi:MAG: aminomethyltransferase family protein [Pyrinomonadaceae bacterium]